MRWSRTTRMQTVQQEKRKTAAGPEQGNRSEPPASLTAHTGLPTFLSPGWAPGWSISDWVSLDCCQICLQICLKHPYRLPDADAGQDSLSCPFVRFGQVGDRTSAYVQKLCDVSWGKILVHHLPPIIMDIRSLMQSTASHAAPSTATEQQKGWMYIARSSLIWLPADISHT